MKRAVVLGLVAALIVCAACDGDEPAADGAVTTDAGSDTGPPVVACERDLDCDDGRFCNGVERCRPGEGDPEGCVPGEPPCDDGECDEDGEDCTLVCANEDGDGHGIVPCGDDCDDTDGNRYPGNSEVCDTAGHDEDCDPETYGFRDQDGDTEPDAACCNGDVCGIDCDDLNPAIGSRAAELCDGLDNDCNGVVDDRTPSCACAAGEPARPCGTTRDGALVDDGSCVIGTEACVDGTWVCSGAVFAMAERCDGAEDEDCDGAVDEDTTIACYVDGDTDGHGAGTTLVDVCPTATGACPVEYSAVNDDCNDAASSVSPSADEACNGDDDDCDGTLDEDFECPANGTVSGVNLCGHTGARRCASNCTWIDADYFLAAESALTCDYCDDTGRGLSEETGPAEELTNLLVGDDTSDPITLGNAQDVSSFILLASFFDRTSAAYFEPLEFGHGPVVIETQILVSSNRASPPPGMGWALVVLEEGSGSLLGGGGTRLGVPSGFDGYAVEWRFDNATVERDTVALNRLDAASPPPVRIGTVHNINSPPGVDADTNEVTQRIRVTLRADEPTTSVDETRIEMEVLDNNGITTRTTCTAADCGHRLVRGARYHIGATAATSSTRDADILISQVTVTRADVCP